MGIETKLYIDRLLSTYTEGGTESNPIKVDLGLIAGELINRFKFPADIAGAAIFETLKAMAYDKLVFNGTPNKYGSQSRELCLHIKMLATAKMQDRAKDLVKDELIKITTCMKLDCPHRADVLKKRDRWDSFVMFWLKPRGFWRI